MKQSSHLYCCSQAEGGVGQEVTSQPAGGASKLGQQDGRAEKETPDSHRPVPGRNQL